MPSALQILVGLIVLLMASFFLLVNPLLALGLLVTALLLMTIYHFTRE